MSISYQDDLTGVSADELSGGFFDGWAEPRSPEQHLEILVGSDAVVLAVDRATGQVVGFVTALTDGVQAAFIPLLEVLPDHRGRGIGTALVQRLLDRLAQLNDGRGINVDLSCDEELVPFYERLGLRPGRSMWVRPHLERTGPRPSSAAEHHVGAREGVRPAVAEDADALVSLMAVMGYEADVSTVAARLERLPDDHAVLVATERQQVVGWIHVHVEHSLIVGRRAQLGGLAIAQGREGRGFGRRLLRAAEEWAGQQGCAVLRVRSGAQRHGAHRFYTRCGYRRTKSQEVLEKDLDTTR